MRTTTFITILGAAALTLSGCTVKDVDQPALAGPSTFAHSIVMTAERNTLTQNGVDFTDIRVVSLGPDGRSEAIPLKAQIFVDGTAQDFGTLSTKDLITPATFRYTAPNGSSLAGAQSESTVTIAVTPTNSGDFRAEVARQLDIRLQPQGIILPTNPNLVAAFTVTPAAPQAGLSVTFDASTSTNGGSACAQACSYTWDFGDGSTGAGITTTHTFRSAGNYAVKLTVTDARGAQATRSQTVAVASPTPPAGTVTVSPTPPVATNADVFFNASAVTWTGRTITGYSWNFGDGTTGSGVTTTHRFSGVGTYKVVLTVTDASGMQGALAELSVQVSAQGGALANVTVTPASPKVGQTAVFDASTSTPSTGATIVSYRFNYGDGAEDNVSTPVQSHIYAAAGTVTVTVEITDSNGKTSTKVLSVTVTP